MRYTRIAQVNHHYCCHRQAATLPYEAAPHTESHARSTTGNPAVGGASAKAADLGHRVQPSRRVSQEGGVIVLSSDESDSEVGGQLDRRRGMNAKLASGSSAVCPN